MQPDDMTQEEIEYPVEKVLAEKDKRIAELEKNFNNALDRIWDLLQQDDGQAYKEAERFYKRHKQGE